MTGLPSADRPHRVRVRAHAPTARASALVFGDTGPALGLPAAEDVPADRLPALCGPEPACGQTAAAAGWAAQVTEQLRGPDCGHWTGMTLGEVAAADPAGLAGWLADPDARPHGGETLTELVGRLTDLLERPPLPGPTLAEVAPDATVRLWVATPLVVRALVVAALGAAPAVVFGVDISFGGEIVLSGSGRRWRLQGLSRS